MTSESETSGLDVEGTAGDKAVRVRIPRDEVFLHELHLNAMFYSIFFALKSDYQVVQPITVSDAEALVSLMVKFRAGAARIGGKKSLEIDITGREMTAYGKMLPRMEPAMNYIAAMGGPSRSTVDNERGIEVRIFGRLNEAFVLAGGRNDLKLVNELSRWAGVT